MGYTVRAIYSKLSLRLTAPLLLSLPVLVALAILSLIAFWQARMAANKLAGDQLVEIHGRIDQRLTDLLSTPDRLNRINAQLIADDRLDTEDLRSWYGILYEQAMAFDMLSGILWGSAEGEVVWMFRYPGKEGYEFGIKDEATGDEVFEFRVTGKNERSQDPVGRYVYDPRKRPWYTDVATAGRSTWTEYAWVNEDGDEVTYGLARPQPYYDENGDLLGVLDAEVSLHDVSNFLASLEVGESGLTFLMDDQGNLVANSMKLPVHDGELNRIPASSSEDPIISAVARRLSESGEQTHRETIAIGGTEYLVIASPLTVHESLKWLIVTAVPEHDFLGEVYELRRRSFYFGIAAVVATLLFGVALASLSVRPLIALVAHVREIGAGNLDEKLELDYASEFVQLSHEINSMTEGLKDRMRMRHSLALAMEVQQNLLPSDTPSIEGLDISGHSTYCDETGGDYYDFLDVAGLSDDSISIALGDVMGHGVAAAMLMATARGVLRSRCQEPGSLGDLLGHMNEMLVADTGGERFMTMMLMTFDMERRDVRWASAGHDPPIIFDAQTDQFVEHSDEGGPPLGIFEETTFEESQPLKIKQGHIFVVSTDGVWETMNEREEVFGMERFLDLIRKHAGSSADEISQQVRAALVDFRGANNQDDDVTFVIIKVE